MKPWKDYGAMEGVKHEIVDVSMLEGLEVFPGAIAEAAGGGDWVLILAVARDLWNDRPTRVSLLRGQPVWLLGQIRGFVFGGQEDAPGEFDDPVVALLADES